MEINVEKEVMRISIQPSPITTTIDEEMCVCFIDWQKAFERLNWTKLMQILKRIGIDW